MGARRPTVGRLIADALADAGVEWAFTVPGESFLGVLGALPEAGIRVVATRHEGGASFMAEAVGKLTGRPAAVLGTRAVGASNMAIGIHTASQDSTPMVALVGQVERAFRGREAFQEVELATTIGGLAKWATELTDAATAADNVGEGLREMVDGRPGPVLFSLPEDLLDEPAGAGDVVVSAAPPPELDASSVDGVLDLLTSAERPVIFAGGGVLRAGGTDKLVRLAEYLRVPVVAAWRRPDVFPNEHPLYLGMTGYGAARTVEARLADADALLVLGSRLSEVASFGYRIPAPVTRWAHVDVAPLTPCPGLPEPDIALAADASSFLEAAVARAPIRSKDRGREVRLEMDRAAYVAASRLDAGEGWSGPGVHPGRVVTALQRMLPSDAILTTDAGNFGLWLARGYRFGRPGTFLGPTSGAMGYGLPAAIAASLCRPERTVVGLAGDGGFAMTMAELETAVRTGSKPVMLVFDNRRYGTISMHQHREGRAAVATELGPVDFAAVARACGAHGVHVRSDDEFEPALSEALAAGVTAVLHLEIDARWVTPDQFVG